MYIDLKLTLPHIGGNEGVLRYYQITDKKEKATNTAAQRIIHL